MLDGDDLEAFFGALGSRKPRDTTHLGDALTQVVDRAREKWPQVKSVPTRAFLATLGRRLTRASSAAAGLSTLRTSDLYAALAAAQGEAAAIDAVLRKSQRSVTEALRALDLDASAQDEVLQRMRERLFVSQAGKPPRIAGYSGSGSLAAWLSAAAVRLAIDMKRAERVTEDALDERLVATLADSADAELRYIKEKYRREFREAFQASFQALTLTERNLLRLTYLDRLSIDELGTMLGLHRSTVARRLARLRDELAENTKDRMRERLKLSRSELNSLMRLVTSAFDISLSGVLRSRDSKRGRG